MLGASAALLGLIFVGRLDQSGVTASLPMGDRPGR
jgi:hypothetical protein